MLRMEAIRGVSEIVDMHKNSHLGEQLYLKHCFNNGFPHILGSSTAFGPVASDSLKYNVICRADRDIF